MVYMFFRQFSGMYWDDSPHFFVRSCCIQVDLRITHLNMLDPAGSFKNSPMFLSFTLCPSLCFFFIYFGNY